MKTFPEFGAIYMYEDNLSFNFTVTYIHVLVVDYLVKP